MAISFTSALTFKIRFLFAGFFISSLALANLEGDQWIFHYNGKDYAFKRAGDLTGSPLVMLRDIAAKFDLEYKFNAKTSVATLSNPPKKISADFSPQSSKAKGPWGEIELSRAPIFISERMAVPIDFGDRVLRPLLSGEAPPKPKAPESLFQTDLVIDPGHGGNDYGAHVKVGKDEVKEKDLTLQIAKELKKEFASRGIRCLLTRNEDIYLTLHERTQFANRAQAKFFLSLHLNADPKKKSKGYELYILSLATDPKTRSFVARENQIIPEDLPAGVEKAIADLRAESNLETSLGWAKILSASLAKNQLSFGKAIKMGPFYVLYGADMPSVLAELGFITDDVDRVMLRSPSHRAKLLSPFVEALATELKRSVEGAKL